MNSLNLSTSIPAIEVNDLEVIFGNITALSGIQFKVPFGSITGLVGPNGAGKTTLIRVLATLLVPSRGSAKVAGLDVLNQTKEVRKLIGYMPDSLGIYQDMKVNEYLRFFARAYGLGKTETSNYIEYALEISNLTERANSFIEELSSGMRSKLSFVRSLAGNPEVLLLDEPLANLDPVTRAEMRKIISTMRTQGKCVLISSHQLEDIEKICDGVIFIHKGKIIEEKKEDSILYSFQPSKIEKNIEEIIKGIKGVSSVFYIGEEKRFIIQLKADANTAEIIREITEHNIDILEWRKIIPTLEERLLKVLKEVKT